MADEDDVLATLMRALEKRAEDSQDRSMRKLFVEVRDELRTLNANLSGETEQQELDAETEELAKHYPALRTRPPVPRRRRSRRAT
jgi:hypothetical protein